MPSRLEQTGSTPHVTTPEIDSPNSKKAIRTLITMTREGLLPKLRVLALLLAGCSATGLNGDHPYPETTNVMLREWAQCEDRYDHDLTSPVDAEDRAVSDEASFENYKICVNSLPERYCNATVLGDGYDEDTDGDGVTNWSEFQIGLNPCEEYSVGGTVADGDFDYDGDGIDNKDDELPLCNPEAPTGDCI